MLAIMWLAAWISGCEKTPPRVAVRELLDPASQMGALHRYWLEANPDEIEAIGWQKLDAFAGSHRDVTVSQLRATPGRPNRILVTWHDDPGGGEWLEQTSIQQSVDTARVLRPRRILYYFIFAADGTSITAKTALVIGGNIADLNGDGEPEIFQWNSDAVPNPIPGLDAVQPVGNVLLSHFVIRPMGEDSKPTFAVLYNAHPESAAAENVWTFRIRDKDGDGIFDIELGPATAPDGIEPRVAFRWSERERQWRGPEPKRSDHFRVLDPARYSEAAMEIAQHGGLGYPVTPAVPVDPELERFLGRWGVHDLDPDDLSKPYEAQDLAILSDEQLLRYFECAPVSWDLKTDKMREATVVPGLWTLPPKEAARQYVLRNRPPSSWSSYIISADAPPGESPPTIGDVSLTDGPSGCFAPGGSYVTHLHCGEKEAYLLYAGSLDFWRRSPIAHGRSFFDLRKISLTSESARHLLQTIWWMGHIRSLNVAQSQIGAGGSGGSTSDGRATVDIVSNGGTRLTVTGTRYSDFPGTFMGIGTIGEGYEPSSFVSLVTQLFARDVPEDLGAIWTDQGNRQDQDLTPPQERELRRKAGELLQMCIQGKADPGTLAVTATAIGEMNWTQLESLLRRAEATLGPLRAHEERIARLDGYIDGWRRRLGEEAGKEGRYERERRKSLREMAQNGGGIGGMGMPMTTAPNLALALTPQQQAKEKSDKKFAIVDALHAARESAEYNAPKPDRAIAEAREAIAIALRRIEVANDPDGLVKWGMKDELAARYAIARLAKVDRAKALTLLRHCEAKEDHEMTREAFRAAREELEDQDFIGPRPEPAMEMDTALSMLRDSQGNFADRERALQWLVPAEDPRRHPEVAIDALLLELLSRDGNADQRRPVSLAISAARRLGGKAWDALMKFPEKDTMIGLVKISAVLPALTLIAEQEPERFRALHKDLVERELKVSHGYLNSTLWSAWILDLREIDAELRRLATRGPEDYDSPMGFGGSNQAGPIVRRLHRARHLVALWSQKEPRMQARALVAFAMANAAMFSEFEGTSARRLAAEIARAKQNLQPEDLAAVREFIDWSATFAPKLRRPASAAEVKLVAKLLREGFAR